MDKETSHVRAWVVVIHYRSSEALLEMLNCLHWLNDNGDVGLMIVDNASGPEELTKIRPVIAELSHAQLLESATNRGYFGAARFGFDHYLEQGNSLPDWVIVCNHDVHIGDKEFFAKLLCQDPIAAGVIAPRIQTLPGRV